MKMRCTALNLNDAEPELRMLDLNINLFALCIRNWEICPLPIMFKMETI